VVEQEVFQMMMFLKTRWARGIPAIAILAGLAVLATPAPADAAFKLMLSDTAGTTPVTITDQGAGDANPAVGAITYIASFGPFTITVSTGLSKPILGSPSSPSMDLNVVVAKLAGSPADTLTLRLTDTGFSPIGPGTIDQQVGGTNTATTDTFRSFKSLTNTEFGTDGPSTSLLTFNTPAFSGTSSGAHGAINSAYSMTLVATIAAGAGAASSSFDLAAQNQVPEPATMLAALAGLPFAGLMARRARRRRECTA